MRWRRSVWSPSWCLAHGNQPTLKICRGETSYHNAKMGAWLVMSWDFWSFPQASWINAQTGRWKHTCWKSCDGTNTELTWTHRKRNGFMDSCQTTTFWNILWWPLIITQCSLSYLLSWMLSTWQLFFFVSDFFLYNYWPILVHSHLLTIGWFIQSGHFIAIHLIYVPSHFSIHDDLHAVFQIYGSEISQSLILNTLISGIN